MGYYKTMEPEDKALEEFPGLSREELEEVEWRFNKYLFYQGDRHGRQIWTTCCHEDYYMEGEKGQLTGTHGDRLHCPFCGEEVQVVCMGRIRTGATLRQYIPFLFLHASEDGQTVWAQGYWTTRDLINDPTGITMFLPTRCYRFQPGKWTMWEEGVYDPGMRKCRDRWIKEPFRENGLYSPYADYYVVGYECLENTFLRYTGYDETVTGSKYNWIDNQKRNDLMRYLGLASQHTKQVEMLRKAGVDELVEIWINAQVKCKDIFDWTEADPRKAFRLTRNELKLFLATDKRLDRLRLYKEVKPDLTFWETQALYDRLGAYTGDLVVNLAREQGVPIKKLVKKLMTAWDGMVTSAGRAAMLWRDYITAAGKLGWDLTNPLIQMPRDLERKHDEATLAVRMEADRIENEKAAVLYDSLCKLYSFEDEEYLIRPAKSATEIILEGKALAHCVGGYAERHANGVLAILFLRKKSEPDKPYLTIEMHGSQMIQIHGYKNERVAGAKDPRETNRELLDSWMAWVKAGSKRDKEGRPRLPKKKESAA